MEKLSYTNSHTLFYLQPVAYLFCWNYRTREHTNAINQML